MNWEIILKQMACPRATQDLMLNTKNRDAAVKNPNIKYGPLNLDDEEYWEEYAKRWNTTAEVAKESNCSNCVAFDISPRMEDCMPLEKYRKQHNYYNLILLLLLLKSSAPIF